MDTLDPDIKEWAAQQSRKGSFPLPTRGPDEPDANEDQVQAILRQARKIDPQQVRGLGTWQAEALLQHIRHERKDLEEDVMTVAREEQALRRSRRRMTLLVIALVIFALWWW